MKKISIVVGMSLALGVTFTASTAVANPGFHAHGTVGRFSAGHSFSQGHAFQTRGFATPRFHAGGTFNGGRGFPQVQPFHRHGFGQHPFFPRRFVPFAVIAPPFFAYSSPSIFDTPYYDAVDQPAPVYSAPAYSAPAYAPPAPPPMPRVVEFPTGRYELRGDGVTAPYMWVWIPNPPPAPPMTPPGSMAPPPPPSAAATPPDAPTPVRRTEVYRWVDEQGVVHMTDRLDRVPQQYQREAKSPKIF
jgi:hypothetical protein